MINVVNGTETYTDVENIKVKNASGDVLKTLLLSEISSGAGGQIKDLGDFTNTTNASWYSEQIGNYISTLTASFDYGMIVIKLDSNQDVSTEDGCRFCVLIYTPERIYVSSAGYRASSSAMQTGFSMYMRTSTGKGQPLTVGTRYYGSSSSYAISINKQKTVHMTEIELPNLGTSIDFTPVDYTAGT